MLAGYYGSPVRCWLVTALCALLTFDLIAAPPARWSQAPPRLQIVIVEGEGAINNIKRRTAREPIVEVTDENQKPLAAAVVVFLLPNTGAGGTFRDGSRMLSVLTDQNGRAVAKGLRPNSVSGKFEIRVTASYEGQAASATITQTNAVLGAAAGGAGAGTAATGSAGAGAGAAGAGAAAGGLSAAMIGVIVGVAAAGSVGVGVALKGRGGNGGGGGTQPRIPSATIGGPGGPVFGPPR